ncbi:hypothetical protein H257_07133 [Aphanomyces astaci]|uniref:Secreted protein n=1 Tax=Aphanomyces astaci TaxID=112090 RepID=W4GLL5_APHAT|nr:hypothetical protein H257_07133 [Aphanomyces astaci]ETV79934.1 hypothetical protein H257_07133 [Aphanomyces astaci]|eukprot:XP_009830870.1 hypothetical protein H257_07133 [Aphanomyces astaci]
MRRHLVVVAVSIMCVSRFGVVSGLHWNSKYTRTVDPNDKAPPILDGTALTPASRLTFYLKLVLPTMSPSTLRLPGDLDPYDVVEDVQRTMRQMQHDVTATTSTWLSTFVAKINKDDTYD